MAHQSGEPSPQEVAEGLTVGVASCFRFITRNPLTKGKWKQPLLLETFRFHPGSGLQPANRLIVVAHQQFDQVVDRRKFRLVFLAVLKAEKPDITQVY